jgi:Fe-S cluster assembly protein SufD
VLNAVRDQAFEDFKALGIPTKKVERYKYTDMQQLFEPDYGLNLNRFDIRSTPMMPSVATCPTSAHRCIS